MVAIGAGERGKSASASGREAEGLRTGLFVRAEVGVVENNLGIGGFTSGDNKSFADPGGIIGGGHNIIFVDGILEKLDFFAVLNGDDADPGVFFGFDAQLLRGGGFRGGGVFG